MQCWAHAWLFLRLLQVLCKLLTKGLTNLAIHDIMHAAAWRGEAFMCTRGEVRLCLYSVVSAQAQISHGAQKCHA